MTAIHENGGFTLASFGYDDLGRRSSLTRGNGVTTSYGYDASGRLGTLSFGGAQPNSYGFGYNAAGQITSRTSSNDAYAWTGATNVDRSYGVNVLNQYTSAGTTTFGYDGRGNLTSSGSDSYQYNTRNQLFMNGSNQLIYRNPAGELGQTPGVNYDWVNGQLAQESGSGVIRRWVYGPGTDEPLVWYEGAGTSDRRYMVADERGSVVAVTDAGGNAMAINTYDEHGIPGGNGQVWGRFGYTGQIWVSELGLYDYKARMYSPTLGRFMQTDPIGYGDGLNWYAYAHGDAVNGTDPSGMLIDKMEWNCFGNCGGGYANSFVVDSFGVHSENFSTNPDGSLKFVAQRDDYYNVYSSRPLPTFGSSGIANGGTGAAGLAMGTGGGMPGSLPQNDDPPGTIVVTYHTNRGPTFGVLDQFNNSRGVLSHSAGGYDQALRDLDDLARWNGQAPLGNKGIVNGPPAGWFVAPISNGVRIFTPGGLQMRVTPGSVRIDIPAGFRVGPSFTDTSNFGETVHYGQ